MSNLDPKTLRTRVENISTVPTVPSVLKQLSTIIENPKISLNEISHFVSKDPALTTKILQMVNSALYGFPGRISSVNHAVMLLGLNVVKGLLLSVSVFEIMHKAMMGLREHSIGVAIASKVIAQKKGLKEPEEVFVAGLLHDVGKVILILMYPEEYDRAIKESEMSSIAIFETERNSFLRNPCRRGGLAVGKMALSQETLRLPGEPPPAPGIHAGAARNIHCPHGRYPRQGKGHRFFGRQPRPGIESPGP